MIVFTLWPLYSFLIYEMRPEFHKQFSFIISNKTVNVQFVNASLWRGWVIFSYNPSDRNISCKISWGIITNISTTSHSGVMQDHLKDALIWNKPLLLSVALNMHVCVQPTKHTVSITDSKQYQLSIRHNLLHTLLNAHMAKQKHLLHARQHNTLVPSYLHAKIQYIMSPQRN